MDLATAATAVSGLGGTGVGARMAIHWLVKESQEKKAGEKAKSDASLQAISDAHKTFHKVIDKQGGFVMAMFAIMAVFILMSPIILPAFINDLTVTVYLPKDLNFWAVHIPLLKKIVVGSGQEGMEAIRNILLLPIHFAMCTNIITFWCTGEAIKS